MPPGAERLPSVPDPGPQVLEWQGAEVASVRWDGPDLVVRLATAWVRPSAGACGGFSQPVECGLRCASTHASLGALVGRLASGTTTIHGARPIPVLTVPVQVPDAVTLDLAFANGEALVAQGRGMWARAAGPVHVQDDLRC